MPMVESLKTGQGRDQKQKLLKPIQARVPSENAPHRSLMFRLSHSSECTPQVPATVEDWGSVFSDPTLPLVIDVVSSTL
jgi:hypothetical protein